MEEYHKSEIQRLEKENKEKSEKMKKIEEKMAKLESNNKKLKVEMSQKTPKFNQVLENVEPAEEVTLPLNLPVLNLKKKIKNDDAAFKKRFKILKLRCQ